MLIRNFMVISILSREISKEDADEFLALMKNIYPAIGDKWLDNNLCQIDLRLRKEIPNIYILPNPEGQDFECYSEDQGYLDFMHNVEGFLRSHRDMKVICAISYDNGAEKKAFYADNECFKGHIVTLEDMLELNPAVGDMTVKFLLQVRAEVEHLFNMKLCEDIQNEENVLVTDVKGLVNEDYLAEGVEKTNKAYTLEVESDDDGFIQPLTSDDVCKLLKESDRYNDVLSVILPYEKIDTLSIYDINIDTGDGYEIAKLWVIKK